MGTIASGDLVHGFYSVWRLGCLRTLFNSIGPPIAATHVSQLLYNSFDYYLCLVVSSLLSRRLPTNKDVFALSCLLCAPRGIDRFVRFEVLHGSTLGKGRVLVGVGIGDILRCVVPRIRCLLPLEGVDEEALVVGRWVVQDTIHTVDQPRPCLGRARLLPWWQVCRDDASAVDQHLLLVLRGKHLLSVVVSFNPAVEAGDVYVRRRQHVPERA